MAWELEKDGCEFEYIVDHFENSKVYLIRYILSNISVNSDSNCSTCINLISKCEERPHNDNTITFILDEETIEVAIIITFE